VPPGPPELTESVQQHDEGPLRTELFADSDMEANPVGSDIRDDATAPRAGCRVLRPLPWCADDRSRGLPPG
jgi:hypothetical protein